jgi:hypothetical protein
MLELTDLAIDMVFLLGGPPASAFDEVLLEHGFDPAPLVFGIDLDARHRLWNFLWLGGRVALRQRSWAAPARDPATAFALTGLALVAARFDLGRALDIGVVGGLGAGPLALTMNEATDVHFALHVHAGLEFAFTLTGPLRVLLRVAWDYDRATVNDFGHEVRLGGFSFGIGVEGRQ